MSDEFVDQVFKLAEKIDKQIMGEDLRVSISTMIAVMGQAVVELFEDHDRPYIRQQVEKLVIDGIRSNVEFEMDEQGINQEMTRQ